MKYRQLTKEQFESLHQEFAQFLASQEIDADQWADIKKNNPSLVEEELNLFSDMVWDDVLSRVEFVEHFSEKSINLFACKDAEMARIAIKTTHEVNFASQEGYQWLVQNPTDDALEYFTGTKPYTQERNREIFSLIEQGGNIANGELYQYFKRLINA